MHGVARHPRQGPEGLDPRRHLGGPVGVQRAHPALVAGVQGREQLADLRAAHLADDEAVGPHPQGLADELDEGDPTDTLDVGPAALEPDDVRMVGVELADVLDDDDPLVRAGTRPAAPRAPSSCRPRCHR